MLLKYSMMIFSINQFSIIKYLIFYFIININSFFTLSLYFNQFLSISIIKILFTFNNELIFLTNFFLKFNSIL